MKIRPKLSVGVPVFNGENFLDQLLGNLRKQTYSEFEIVICDNASTDRTQEICLDHANSDTRIRYYRNATNLGANPNFNKVFTLAHAPLFKWAAHDDMYEPDYLKKCVVILDQQADVVLAHTDCQCVDKECQPLIPGPRALTYIDPSTGCMHQRDKFGLAQESSIIQRLWDVLFCMNSNHHIFGVIRSAALKRTGLLRDFYGTDKLLLAELALLGRFVQIPEKLFIKRYHKDMSGALSVREKQRWSQTGDIIRSRRWRQLAAFVPAPFGKDLPPATLAICLGIISLLGPKVIIGSLLERTTACKSRTPAWQDWRSAIKCRGQ
jgi:glycosyltransferase involved in cell wall biosynthesis